MPQRRRSVPVLVIAILQLIFGGVGLICDLCGAVGMAMGDNAAFAGQLGGGQQDPTSAKLKELTKQMEEKKVPGQKVYQTTNVVLNFVLSLMMIASGLGLLYMQSWARWLAVGYACLSLALHCLVIVYTFAFINPAMQEALQQMPAQDRQKLEPIMTAVSLGTYAVACAVPIYPLVVLTMMLLPSTGRAFQSPRSERFDEGEEFDDRDDERRERDDYES